MIFWIFVPQNVHMQKIEEKLLCQYNTFGYNFQNEL